MAQLTERGPSAPGTGSTGESPLSVWLMQQGIKGVSGDPVATIAKHETPDVVKYVQGLIDRSRNHMERHWYRIWQRNLYFTYGAQHIEQDQEGRWTPRAVTEDERKVINLILSKVKRRVSRRCGKPTWRVIARDSTPEEQGRARASEKLLTALHDHKDVTPRRITMEISREIFGSGILKVFWDPRGGPPRRQRLPVTGGDGQPVIDPNTGEPAMTEGEGFEAPGDLCIREVLPFYLHVPASASNCIMNDLDWIGERPPLTVADIWQMYGYSAKPDATAEEPLARLSNDFVRFMEATDLGIQDARPRDQAYVYEYHEKARLIDGFELGVIVTICNDTLISVRPQQLPPELGYPYVHYATWLRPNTFWGHSDVNEEIEPQRTYNTFRMKLEQARDLTALPWLWDPLGSGIPEGALTDGPRVLKGVQKPEFIGPPAMSQALVEDGQQTLADLDRVSNISPILQGQMPGKSPFSAEALQFMKETEDSVMQPEIILGSLAHAALGHKSLELCKLNMTEERVFELAGHDADYGAFLFSGAKVPTSYHVQVQEGSAFYQMKSALRAEIERAMSMGLYGDVGPDPTLNQKLLDHMHYPNPADLTPPEELNRRMAVRESANLLEQGKPPVIHPLENKATHLTEHISRMMQPDFEKWPEEQRKQWMDHITETQALLETEMKAEQKAAYEQGLQQATLGGVEKGKYRDAEAMLLAIRGIMEGLTEQATPTGGGPQET